MLHFQEVTQQQLVGISPMLDIKLSFYFEVYPLENIQPWEFPPGTKEIRYYLQANGCTYLIGGYVDATGSNQPGLSTKNFSIRLLSHFA